MVLESSLPVSFARATCRGADKLSSKSRSRSKSVPSVFGFYGKLNEYYVYSPGYWDFDISLLKNVRISDRFRLQFRAEAFNHANSLVGDNKSLQASRTRSS